MSLEKVANILIKYLSNSAYSLTVVGISYISLLGTNSNSSIAQPPRQIRQINNNQANNNQVNQIFVHPHLGNDSTGNGTEKAPWQTITQALNNVTSDSIIMLEAGTYSTQSGEVFPLIIKPGVAIQGNINNKGKSVIINGGGQYLSRHFGSQNVAIVANDQSRISGVTVTNQNPRGYGLWIESNNSIIKNNIFTQNTQDGIAVTGNSTANISNNYFYRNGANGITISGTAHPEIKENLFQNTGFGVNVVQNATPLILANQVRNNRSGVIVQANAAPILRNNIIENNQEDGLVVIAEGKPDLGSSNDPGKNIFKNNKRYDINAKAAKLVIFASGNNIASNRIKGKLNLSGVSQTANEVNSQPQKRTTTANRRTLSARNNSKSKQLPPLPDNVRDSNVQQNSPNPQKNLPDHLPDNFQEQTQLSGINQIDMKPENTGLIEFVAPQAIKQRPISPNLGKTKTRSSNVRKNQDLQNYRSNENPSPIVINNSPKPTDQTYQVPNLLRRDNVRVQNFQPYPNPYPVVINNSRVQTFQPYPNPYPVIRNTPKAQQFQPYGIGGTIPRYRVLVLINNQEQIRLLNDLAQDAFPRVWRGQKAMQIAVFTNSNNARSMVINLANRGLQAVIEPIN